MNTKRLATVVLGLLAALALSACSLLKGTSAEPQAAAPTNALPKAAQLLVGIIKMEGTDLAVTSEQAAALLPLWKMSRNLSTSDSAAKEESEALTAQIEEVLTSEQRVAIEQMALGPESLREAMQALGLEMGAASAELTAEQEATRTALRQAAGGARGAGGFPGGGGGQGGGAGFAMREGGAPPGGGLPPMDPAQLATMQAGGGARGGMTMGINRALYDALISLLTERAGA